MSTPAPGMVFVNMDGVLVEVETFTTSMNYYFAWIEAAPIQQLVEDGITSPAAVYADAQQRAQAWISYLAPLGVQDANMMTAVPIMQHLQMDAYDVPASQWNPQTYDRTKAFTIAMAVQMSQPKPPPPPPTGGAMVGQCFGGKCYPGPGCIASQITDGEVVTNPDGSKYTAHVIAYFVGTELYFTPLSPTS